ncbi:MAG: permease [Dehalococcoidia bacterium]
MERILKRGLGVIALDMAIFIILVVSVVYTAMADPTKLRPSFLLTLDSVRDIMPTLLLSVFLAGLADVWLTREMVERYLAFNSNTKGFIMATLAGIATPGTLFEVLPFIAILRKRGLKASSTVAFMTGQTLMGPMRTPLEIKYMGLSYFAFRVGLALLLGVVTGFMILPFERWLEGSSEDGKKG